MATITDLAQAVAALVQATNVKLATLDGKVSLAEAAQLAVEEALSSSPSAAALAVNLANTADPNKGSFLVAHRGYTVREAIDAALGRCVINVDLEFNGDLKAAHTAVKAMAAAAPANQPKGWTLSMGRRTYDMLGYFKASDTSGNPANWIYNTVPNLTIAGVGRAKLVGDPRDVDAHFEDGSGSVIQGTVFNMADNFWLTGCSVDVGSRLCNARNGGIGLEGFIPSTHLYTGDGNDESTYTRGGGCINVSVLCITPSEHDFPSARNQRHAFLWEHNTDYYGDDIEIIGGLHGAVFKGKRARFGTVYSWGAWNNTAIFKAEERTLCEDVTIAQLVLGKQGTSYVPPGGGARVPYRSAGALFQSVAPRMLDGSPAGPWRCRGIRIGQLVMRNLVWGAHQVDNTEQILDILVGSMVADNIQLDAFVIGAQYKNCVIGDHICREVGLGISSDEGCLATIGNGQVHNPSGVGYRLAGGVIHGNLHVQGSPGVGVWGYGAAIDPSRITGANNVGGNYSGVRSLSITFENTWNFQDGSTRCELWGRRIVFGGVLGSGSTRFIGTIEPAFRPERPIDIPAMQEFGEVLAPAWVRITPDGKITLWGGIKDGEDGAPGAFVHVMQGEWMLFP